MARPRQRSAGPLRGETAGHWIAAVGAAPQHRQRVDPDHSLGVRTPQVEVRRQVVAGIHLDLDVAELEVVCAIERVVRRSGGELAGQLEDLAALIGP